MDINSLLSPEDSALSGPSTPVQSPRKSRPARSSSLKKSITSSPHTGIPNPPSTIPHHVHTPMRNPIPSPPAMSPKSGAIRGTPPPSDLTAARQASTPSMDTLADLASMQHRQPAARAGAPALRNTDSYESQLSPSTMFPNVPSIPHHQSTPRSSVDLKMADLSSDISHPKNYAGTSLSEADQKLATELAASLADNPYSYENHRQLCKLLHQGFITHVYPPDSPESHGDPHRYDLLGELRSARAAMSRQYSVGHDLFTEWIQDESLLARTVDERLSVMELCQKSIEEEFGCTRLWRTYGEWMLYLYNAVSQPEDAEGVSSRQEWSEDDKLVGREVFNWTTVLDVWKRAAETTKWRMHDSHLVWDRYMELLLQDLAQTQLLESAATVKVEFEKRLLTPHATWEETFQMFSTFISSRPEYNASYEEMMVTTKNHAKDAVAAWKVREMREIPLAQAAEAGESEKQYKLFLEYLEWSVQPTVKKRAFGGILANALFERAVLYFPTDTYLWQEYAYYVIDESQQGNQVNMSTFGVLERATRHCPWSGSLWSQYLLSSESADRTFIETEEIKHKATNTGLLDQGGMEEVLKVLTAWCSYLRRRAFQPEATDEELDIAEMGIRSSIESLQKLGETKYGESYKGDPYFRLERIYIKYLCESGSWDNARETYKGLVATRGDSHDFWMRYYVFEMIAWGKFIQADLGDTSSTKRTPPPSYATGVLKQALQRENLDWPEKIAETLISHCEDHEDVEELQLAVVEVNRANKRIAKRREKEAAEAAFLAQQQQQEAQRESLAKELESEGRPDRNTDVWSTGAVHLEVLAHVMNGKRKRDPSGGENEHFRKKSKPEDEERILNDVQMEDQPKNAESVVKRDRENASIMVKHLPANVSETRIRQFFRDCGTIVSLKALDPDDGDPTALIEFESKEDAEYAQSRDGKTFDGSTIEVQIGTGSTLYVTNYPPIADEKYIRGLFSKYGEIISIRFPSLKFNTHRRFCYVQFKDNASAYAALTLNETAVDSMDGKLRLVVKISDPSQKQGRSGAMQEDREIYVAGIHFNVSEDDLKGLFSKYGSVEQVRIPRKVNGHSRGFGYVVFETKEAAASALVLNQTTHIGRTISVVISAPKGDPKRVHADQARTSSSPQPNSSHLNGAASNSRRSSDAMSTSTNPRASASVLSTVGDRQARTLGLMNIPDTMNDARIRALVEPYGALVKVILRPDHQGAIVEFVDVNDAGKASLGLDGAEVEAGRKIRVGDVGEMLKMSPETRTDRIVIGGGGGHKVGSTDRSGPFKTSLQSTAFVRRPGDPGAGAGRGRRGGLGFSSRPKPKEDEKADGNSEQKEVDGAEEGSTANVEGKEDGKAKKSNQDFRAMILGGK